LLFPITLAIGFYNSSYYHTSHDATHNDVYDLIIIHAYTAATRDAIIIVSSCYIFILVNGSNSAGVLITQYLERVDVSGYGG